MMTEKNVIYQNNDYNLSEPYFRFRSFIWLAQTKKEFQTAKTAENRVDKWDLTWYLLIPTWFQWDQFQPGPSHKFQQQQKH